MDKRPIKKRIDKIYFVKEFGFKEFQRSSALLILTTLHLWLWW